MMSFVHAIIFYQRVKALSTLSNQKWSRRVSSYYLNRIRKTLPYICESYKLILRNLFKQRRLSWIFSCLMLISSIRGWETDLPIVDWFRSNGHASECCLEEHNFSSSGTFRSVNFFSTCCKLLSTGLWFLRERTTVNNLLHQWEAIGYLQINWTPLLNVQANK